MGNKMCKKKTDTVDNPNLKSTHLSFDKIFTRLHLKPTAWKSETHLNKKQVSRQDSKESKRNRNKINNTSTTKALSKSTDWSSQSLEVPEDDKNQIKSTKLSFTFTEKNPPTPPPRKHKKCSKEKVEPVEDKKPVEDRKPVEEPVFTKKTINQSCPLCDHDCVVHNRNHKNEKLLNNDFLNDTGKALNNDSKLKRKKNLSVVSLPTYSELKLAVAHFDDIDKKPDSSAIRNSMTALPHESKKLTHTASTGKLETYMTRCRSIGSLLPQQLLDRIQKTPKKPADIESDDSFGGLEDWDLKLIEHYNPRDASLPRPSRPKKTEKEVLSDLESMIVQEEPERPTPPARRSESPAKKANKQLLEAALRTKKEDENNSNSRYFSITPSPSPINKESTELSPPINYEKFPKENDEKIEHSSLMKILQEYSIKDKQKTKVNGEGDSEAIEYIDASSSASKSSKHSSFSPSLNEFENKITAVEDFINAEKQRTSVDHFGIYANVERAKT